MPTERRYGQMLGRPARHQRHSPQVEKNVSDVTRAPAHAPSTPAPSSATTPQNSWPIVTGGTHRILAGLDVQVGAADARGQQLDHDLAGTGDGLRALGVGDVSRAGRELRDALHAPASV